MTIRAAVDCGSNSIRLLVVDHHDVVLARDLKTTRLGYQLDSTGVLNSESIDRTLFALADFKNQMEQVGVESLRAVATSAVRDASNSSGFLNDAAAVLGQEVDVVSGTDEAALAYRGAISGRTPHDYLLIDIGGGSTELVLGDSTGRIQALSINVGCVRGTERFFATGGPWTEEHIDQVAQSLDQAFAPPAQALAPPARAEIVGVGGTITTLAAVVNGLTESRFGAVHDRKLYEDEVIGLFRQMAQMPVDDLRFLPGMPSDRADVMMAGSAIVLSLFRTFGSSVLTVSENDILDGIVAGL